MLSDFFLTDANRFVDTYEYTYNGWLVLLSYAVAVFASFTAFLLLQRVKAAPNTTARRVWLMTGAVSMGFGIWSMHFVAMVAVEMDHIMYYDPTITALSAVFAVLASGFAFNYVSKGSSDLGRLLLAGVVLGVGIGAMHYTGMFAMRMDAGIRYDPVIFGTSILVAVLLSTAALRLMFHSIETENTQKRLYRFVSAGIMGLSVCCMHYTGMGATSFLAIHSTTHFDEIVLNGSLMGAIIGGLAFAIIGMTLLAAYIDQLVGVKDVMLQRSESMLAQTIASALDAIITSDQQGIISTVNPACEKIFGYSPSNIIGQPLSMLLPSIGDDHEKASSSSFEAVNKDLGENRWLMEGRCKDGSTRILNVTISQMEVNKEYMFTTMVRDYTNRYRAEEALRADQAKLHASEERLNAIMNSVADAVISIDATGTIHSFNASAERIFGYSTEEAVGKNVSTLMAEPDRSQHDGFFRRYVETGEAKIIGTRREVTGQRKDGTNVPLELAISSMATAEKMMFVGVAADKTECKRAEAKRAELERELRQAQKMESLGTLSGGIAHEINTPVQYVGDNIRFLKDAFTDLSTVCEKLKRLREAGGGGDLEEILADIVTDYLMEEISSSIDQSLEGVGRISEIVQAINEFSHPDTKEKRAIDINHALSTTITVARNQWKYVADLETDFDDSLPEVPCLPGEFNQVILNLIVNAAHAIEETATDEKGRITVATRRRDDFIEIRISDTGTGISEENIDKIFDPFFTTKDPGKGTGQGLAISHSIITKKHGGTIHLESERGKGTTFLICLPLAATGEAEEAA